MARFYQYAPSPNEGERVVENYLKKLSDSAVVFAEYRINDKDESSDSDRRPDFLVLSPRYGLVCLEVKDWNIVKNSYRWENQNTLIKKNLSTNKEDKIKNPFSQADEYKHLLRNFCRHLRLNDIYVSSFVVFPKIEKALFYNRFSDLGFLNNPQTKFFFDINAVIFKDDLEQNINSLDKYLLSRCQSNSHFFLPTEENISKLEEALMLPSFSLGGLSKQVSSHRDRIKRLTELQKKWAFGVDGQNALILDIAGSGKTSALISRAMYLSSKYPDQQILITTYNEKLTENIRHLYQARFNNDTLKISPFVVIKSIYQIAKEVLYNFYKEETKLSPTDMIDDAITIIEEDPEHHKIFDYIFIDEVQDFSTMELLFITSLCKSHDKFFFAGDIAQKIYNKSLFDLRSINLKVQDISLPKEYKMYRTPQKIAELALKFVSRNKKLKQEFSEFGYLDNLQQGNDYKAVTEFHPYEEMLPLISSLLAKGYSEEDIIIVTLAENKNSIKELLSQNITILDYQDVKGFEAPCIILHGIEGLMSTTSIFENPRELEDKEIHFRRLIYVALTRTTEATYILYNDFQNAYIKELYILNQHIIKED